MSVTTMRDGSVLTVTLNREPVNALNREMYDGLIRAFNGAKPGDVVVVRSTARHFCSGQDLTEYQNIPDEEGRKALLQYGASALLAALRCKAPIVAAVHGAAVGAGALLACTADVLFASDDASFSLPELHVGIPVGGAIAQRVFGGPLTRRLLLAEERLPAHSLQSTGAAVVVDASNLHASADETAQKLASLPATVTAVALASESVFMREATALAYEAEIDAIIR